MKMETAKFSGTHTCNWFQSYVSLTLKWSWTVTQCVPLYPNAICTQCLAYITIQTLLLWKALSFLLCAAKHYWEHAQNTSKHDTISCCCCRCWLHKWTPFSIRLGIRRKETGQNCTNYGNHHNNLSEWSLYYQRVSSSPTCWAVRVFHNLLHIPKLSYRFCVCVCLGGMVVSIFHADTMAKQTWVLDVSTDDFVLKKQGNISS